MVFYLHSARSFVYVFLLLSFPQPLSAHSSKLDIFMQHIFFSLPYVWLSFNF